MGVLTLNRYGFFMDTIIKYRRELFHFLCIAVLICLHAGILNAQAVGPRAMALGGTSAVLIDPWSVRNNPAITALLEHSAIAVGGSNRFMLTELTEAQTTGVIAMPKSAAGIYFSSYGFKAYQEHQVAASYGLRLSQKVSIGVGMQYERLIQGQDYPAVGGLSTTLGCNFTPDEYWQIGLVLTNISRSTLPNAHNERLPIRFEWGVKRTFSDRLDAYASIEKDIDQSLVVAGGLTYRLVPSLLILSGIRSLDASWRLGLVYQRETMQFSVTQAWSQILGYSAAAALGFQWNK